MRRTTNIIAIAAIALVIGACAAQIQKTVFTAAIPADVIPVTDLELPPFGEDVTSHDVLTALITDLPEGPPPCDIMSAIIELERRMQDVELKVGTKEFRYEEVRNGNNITFKDVEKQIALGLVNPLTCKTRTTIIVKRGDEIVTHEGVDIEPRRRANGIQWNNWATEYTVIRPEGHAVVAVLYPYVQGSGSSRKLIPIFYTPFSSSLYTPDSVLQGLGYLAGLTTSASETLRHLRVPSKAFPGTLVADHPLYQEITIRLNANEHMDPAEFLLDPRFTADRIHVIIGFNRENTARYTCSSAGACGIAQFTEPTYQTMRRVFPGANLMADSLEGRRDHLNVAMAQLLLMDSNMAAFITAFGPEVADDPWVTEGLIAAYNTGAARTITVRAIALQQRLADWINANGRCRKSEKYRDCLLDETKWYIAKERYLREEWNKSDAVTVP